MQKHTPQKAKTRETKSVLTSRDDRLSQITYRESRRHQAQWVLHNQAHKDFCTRGSRSFAKGSERKMCCPTRRVEAQHGGTAETGEPTKIYLAHMNQSVSAETVAFQLVRCRCIAGREDAAIEDDRHDPSKW